MQRKPTRYSAWLKLAVVLGVAGSPAHASAEWLFGPEFSTAFPIRSWPTKPARPGLGVTLRAGWAPDLRYVKVSPEVTVSYLYFLPEINDAQQLVTGTWGMRLALRTRVAPYVFGHVGYGGRRGFSQSPAARLRGLVYDGGGGIMVHLLDWLSLAGDLAYRALRPGAIDRELRWLQLNLYGNLHF